MGEQGQEKLQTDEGLEFLDLEPEVKEFVRAEARHEAEPDKKEDSHCPMPRLNASALDFLPDGRKPAQDQAYEKQVGLNGKTAEKVAESKRTACNGSNHAQGNGQQEQNILLELTEQMRDAVDQFVIDSHGNHHGSATDTGNNICNSDYHTFYKTFNH